MTISKEQADEVVQKAALMAALYYPQVHADDLDYKLSNDVEWSLEDLPTEALSDDERASLRDVVSRFIIDPTGFREDLTGYIYQLTPDES